MAIIYWFCPQLDCEAYGQHNIQGITESFGTKPDDPCSHCGTELDWRT